MTLHTLPVVRAVVHPDGALITRAGPLPVADGRIEVRKLPLLLDPTTLRVRVDGAEIAEVRAELDLLDEDRAEAPKRLEALRSARDELAALDVEVEASRELRRTLAALVPGFDDGDPRRPVPDPARFTAWLEADRAIGLRVEALDETLRSLLVRRRDLAERLAVLEHEAQAASTEERWQRWMPTRRVSIRAVGARAAELQVELSYRIAGATWSPAYTLDADEALRSGRFSMRASIVQATGEDWRGVRVTLSSAPSERWIDVPELASMRLGTRQRAAPSGWRALPADLDALFPPEIVGVSPPTEPGPAKTETLLMSTRFGGEPGGRAAARERALDGVAAGVDDDVDLGEAEWMAEEEDLSSALEPVTGATPAPAPTRRPMSKSRPKADGAPRPPPAPPSSAAMPEAMARRSVSMVGGAVGDVVGALVSAPLAAAAALAPKGGRGRAAGPGMRRAEGEPQVDIEPDWLEYGRLRLADWTAGPGARGRLKPVSEAEVLIERGAQAAVRRLVREQAASEARATAVGARALPPHHVVPGPVQGNDVRIDAQGAVDVPSDGLPHSVAVEAWPADLEVSYRTVPRADPRAFRRVAARLQYDRALLPGPVDVYVGGKLELTSPWPGSAGRGVLRIGLGAEDRLKVVRNVRYTEASAGVFGGSRRLQTDIEVKLASSLGRPVSVEILERLPVPLDGREVTVEQTEASPLADPYEGEADGPILTGGRRQVVEVPPGGEARAVLGYAVTLGSKDEIVGGDRRG
jgi:hypothetical protein